MDWTLCYIKTPFLSVTGLFVIGPGKEGILLEHRESEWGDGADLKEVLRAVHKMKACPATRQASG